MHVNSHTANSGGREVWGFPQKLARPSLAVVRDTLLGTLDVGPVAWRAAAWASSIACCPRPRRWPSLLHLA